MSGRILNHDRCTHVGVCVVMLMCNLCGCVSKVKDNRLYNVQRISSSAEFQPVIAVWWDDHSHHYDAGYRVYFCAWEDGIVIDARSYPGRDEHLRVFQLNPSKITTLVENIESLGFFDHDPFTKIDLNGATIFAIRNSERSNAYVLNQPPMKSWRDSAGDLALIWDGAIEILEEVDLTNAEELRMETLVHEQNHEFRGLNVKTGRATWMRTSTWRD